MEIFVAILFININFNLTLKLNHCLFHNKNECFDAHTFFSLVSQFIALLLITSPNQLLGHEIISRFHYHHFC